MGLSQAELIGIVIGAVIGFIVYMVLFRWMVTSLRKTVRPGSEQQALERLSRMRLVLMVGETAFGAFIGYQVVQIFGH